MPDAENKTIILNDVFARAAQDENFGMALGMVLNQMIVIGREKGIIE